MKINIEVIPHAEQRYPTCGDWWVDDDGVVQVRGSLMKDRRHTAFVILHELVEMLVEGIKMSGTLAVPPKLIAATDKFDKAYEAKRKPDDETSEPGYAPKCPVYQGHMIASAVEHIAAMLMAVDYNEYQREIASL